MLAILDAYQIENPSSGDGSSMGGASNGSNKTKEFQPVDLVRSILSLPEQFLCDAGDLYDTVFGRPPVNVIKEAVQLIVDKAYESSSSSLGLQQINLALKQLQLDAVCGTTQTQEEPSTTATQETVEEEEFPAPEQAEDEDVGPQKTGYDSLFRTKIMIELIRIHIQKTIETQQAKQAEKDKANGKDKENEKEKDKDPFAYTSASSSLYNKGSTSTTTSSVNASKAFASSYLSTSTSDRDRELEKKREQEKEELIAKLNEAHTVLKIIETKLNTPIPEVMKQAMQCTPEELEANNNLLKPYLKRLANLKTSLSVQLTDLRDSKAFLALGLSSTDATEDEIKKAYRTLAIRYHPDKPGGDTVKFQQLQVSYQEVLKRKKISDAEKDALKEMTEKFVAKKKATAATGAANSGTNSSKQSNGFDDDEDGPDPIQKKDFDFDEVDKELFPERANSQKEKEKQSSSSKGKKSSRYLDSSSSDSESESETESENDENDENDSKNSNSLDSDRDKKNTKAKLLKEKTKSKDDETKTSSTSTPSVTVEDDSDKEEDTIGDMKRVYPENTSTNAKNTPNTMSYHQIAPEFERKYESHTEHAEMIVQHVLQLLPMIQIAANECSSMAQKCLKWQKKIDKISNKGKFPQCLRDLYDLLQLRIQHSSGIVNPTSLSSPGSTTTNTTPISLQSWLSSKDDSIPPPMLDKVIPCIEFLCEISQRVASLGMEFASECGSHYASAAATDSDFLKVIETCMQSSLATLRSVNPINTANEQLTACARRVSDSIKYALTSQDIHSVLSDMIKTAVRNATATMCGTVDHVVKTVMLAMKLKDILVRLLEKAKIQALADARRRADYERDRETEMDYCEEDREAIRQARMNNNGQNSGKDKGKKDGDDDDEEEDEENAEKEVNESEEDMDVLSGLRNKIKQLHAQLNVQQIQALQTMNAETIVLQDEILDELKQLPFFSSVYDLLDDKSTSFRELTGQLKKGMKKEKGKRQRGGKKGVTGELKESVISLIAEFVDNSMNALRQQANSSSSTVSSSTLTQSTLTQMLEDEFSWLRITFSDGSNGKDCWIAMIKVVEDLLPINDLTDNNSNNNFKLALFPDYRSKTLYFGTLLDVKLIKDMLLLEVPGKLKEVVQDILTTTK